MLSFAIFLTFTVFLFIAFNPAINFEQDKEPILDHLKIELLALFSSSLENINDAADRYNSNYEGLKTDLGVPENVEFAFIFSDDGIEDIVAEKHIPKVINVYTKNVLVLYDNNKEAGFLTIKVW